MLNFLRMDLKRFARTRSFYVALLVALFFLGIFSLAAYYVTGFAEEFAPQAEGMMNDQVLDMARKRMTFNFFFSFFFSLPGMRMLHALLSLFAAGFLSREHQSGYFKNLLSIPGMRAKWLLSKLGTLLAASALFYALFGAGCLVVLALYGNPVAVNLSQVLPFAGGQLLVDMALYAVILLAVLLLQSRAAAVLIAMALSLNMQGLFYLLIDWLKLLPFKLTDLGMMNLAARAELPGSVSSLLNMVGQQQSFGLMGGSPDALLPVAGTVFAIFFALSLLAIYRVDYRG